MSSESHFQIAEEKRTAFIQENIVDIFRKEAQTDISDRVSKIVSDFEGRDADALSVLLNAAEQGRLDEFANQLERFHKETFQYLDPRTKSPGVHSGVDLFFTTCNASLGIGPREQSV